MSKISSPVLFNALRPRMIALETKLDAALEGCTIEFGRDATGRWVPDDQDEQSQSHIGRNVAAVGAVGAGAAGAGYLYNRGKKSILAGRLPMTPGSHREYDSNPVGGPPGVRDSIARGASDVAGDAKAGLGNVRNILAGKATPFANQVGGGLQNMRNRAGSAIQGIADKVGPGLAAGRARMATKVDLLKKLVKPIVER